MLPQIRPSQARQTHPAIWSPSPSSYPSPLAGAGNDEDKEDLVSPPLLVWAFHTVESVFSAQRGEKPSGLSH